MFGSQQPEAISQHQNSNISEELCFILVHRVSTVRYITSTLVAIFCFNTDHKPWLPCSKTHSTCSCLSSRQTVQLTL